MRLWSPRRICREQEEANEQFNELTEAFSFWPSPDKRIGGNIRSFSLRPGFRASSSGATCGRTSIWCHESMADRKGCREATWHYPEWNNVVANTLPLVKTMKTR